MSHTSTPMPYRCPCISNHGCLRSTGSEMVLADDIESFWLSAPFLSSADSATAGASQIDCAYSQESSALSHAPSLGTSISRHHSATDGDLLQLCAPFAYLWRLFLHVETPKRPVCSSYDA